MNATAVAPAGGAVPGAALEPSPAPVLVPTDAGAAIAGTLFGNLTITDNQVSDEQLSTA